MRKLLTAFVVLTLVVTCFFCCACNKDTALTHENTIAPVAVTVSFEATQKVVNALDAYAAANADFTFSHYMNETYHSETLTRVQKGDVEVVDNYDTNTYISYYINKKDATLIDAAVDPVYYNDEAFYLTLVTVEKLTVDETLKIAFVTVTWDGGFTSSTINKTPAILVSFAN